jgi:hypothetical protein
MTTTREVLIAAKALIDTPEKWCQGAYMRDRNGARCCLTAKDAVKWCGLGAIGAVTCSHSEYSEAINLLNRAVPVGHGSPYFAWQDAPGRTHAEVMAAFDEAIRRAG